MNIYTLSLTTLQFTGLLLPYLVLVVHNSFAAWWLTIVRGLVAIGAGWVFWLSFVFSADAINHAAATTELEIESLNDGDGAKFAFATVFGWVVPAITVAGTWAFHAWVVPRLRPSRSNKTMEPMR